MIDIHHFNDQIDRLKNGIKKSIIIKVSRHLQDLEDYEEQAFNYLTSEEFDEGIDIENRTIRDLIVRDLATLFTSYENTNALKGMDYDKLLLVWLKSRGIDYEINESQKVMCVNDRYF
jgi:hypothetical protein